MVKEKSKQTNIGKVIIPENLPTPPMPHEVNTALSLARHYQTRIEFLIPIDDFKRKTADIVMFGVEWELKCPTGTSKATIQNQFRRASKQAKNIILDTRRTKLKYEVIEKRVYIELKNHPNVDRVTLIDKKNNIIEIKK